MIHDNRSVLGTTTDICNGQRSIRQVEQWWWLSLVLTPRSQKMNEFKQTNHPYTIEPSHPHIVTPSHCSNKMAARGRVLPALRIVVGLGLASQHAYNLLKLNRLDENTPTYWISSPLEKLERSVSSDKHWYYSPTNGLSLFLHMVYYYTTQ